MPKRGSKVHPPLLYAVGLFAGLGLDRLMPLAPAPGGWVVPPGIVVLLAGLAFHAWAVVAMTRARLSRVGGEEARRGPFRFSESPVDLAYALEQAGIALMLGSWWGIVLAVPILLVMTRLPPRAGRRA